MDTHIVINNLVLVASIIATISTAIITYMTSRASIKYEGKRVDLDIVRAEKDEKMLGVEAVERLGNISLAMVQSLQAQLLECTLKREDLFAKNEELALLSRRLRNKIHEILNDLDDVVDNHERLHRAGNINCPEYEAIQSSIQAVVERIKGEIPL